MDRSFLLLFASFLFSAICKSSSHYHFAFFVFLFLGDGFDQEPLEFFWVRSNRMRTAFRKLNWQQYMSGMRVESGEVETERSVHSSEERLSNPVIWLLNSKGGEVVQACLTLCDTMDCSPPGSSVHGIIQTRILEWGAIPFSRGSSWPRDWNWGLLHCRQTFTLWAPREATNCKPSLNLAA